MQIIIDLPVEESSPKDGCKVYKQRGDFTITVTGVLDEFHDIMEEMNSLLSKCSKEGA